jgi:hypothetical protein
LGDLRGLLAGERLGSAIRAARYREQADRLNVIANSDNQPRSRARLLDLAEEYRRLADMLGKNRSMMSRSRTAAPVFSTKASAEQLTIRAVAAV